MARADGDEEAVVFELAGDGVIVRSHGTDEKTVHVGCVARSFASQGSRAWVLCGTATVVTIDATPEPHIVLRQRYGTRFVSLTTIEGVVSARTTQGVKPLDQYAVATDAETPEPPPTHRVHHQIRYAHDDDVARQIPPPPSELPVTGLEIDATASGGVGTDNFVGAWSTLDAAFIYRFKFPLSIAAYGLIGAGTGGFDNGNEQTGPNGGDVQVATGEALISLDTSVFAIGVGVGVGLFERAYDVEPLFVTRGRIGEVDALEFRWHMAFATGGNSLLGAVGGALEFRLNPRWWLGAEAEFGNLRYGRVMLDVRRRMIAQRDHKGATLDLRMGIGLAYVETSSNCTTPTQPQNDPTVDAECIGTNIDYLGPALSFGLVFRP